MERAVELLAKCSQSSGLESDSVLILMSFAFFEVDCACFLYLFLFVDLISRRLDEARMA